MKRKTDRPRHIVLQIVGGVEPKPTPHEPYRSRAFDYFPNY
jgi:hypothetical protein